MELIAKESNQSDLQTSKQLNPPAVLGKHLQKIAQKTRTNDNVQTEIQNFSLNTLIQNLSRQKHYFVGGRQSIELSINHKKLLRRTAQVTISRRQTKSPRKKSYLATDRSGDAAKTGQKKSRDRR